MAAATAAVVAEGVAAAATAAAAVTGAVAGDIDRPPRSMTVEEPARAGSSIPPAVAPGMASSVTSYSTHREAPMYPKHVHTPISTRARCPVCRQAVYSRAGIHPQCAERQAEPPRPKVKARRHPSRPPRSPWVPRPSEPPPGSGRRQRTPCPVPRARSSVGLPARGGDLMPGARAAIRCRRAPRKKEGGPPPADTACCWSGREGALGQGIASFRRIDRGPPRLSLRGRPN